MKSNDKLASAAHLLIARLPTDELGATKLNKILWFADCEFYFHHGRSLTGETEYVRKANGPCPVRIAEVLAQLKAQGAIVERAQPVAHYTRREFVPITQPDVSVFTSEEIDLLLGTALALAPMSARAASDLSHNDLWHATPPEGRMSVEAGSVLVSQPAGMEEWAAAAFAAE